MANDIGDLFAERERDRFALHTRHLNRRNGAGPQAVGYDIGFCRGEGQYLYDRQGTRYPLTC